VGQLHYAQRLARNASESVRGDLLDLSAELSRLAGWAYFDTRQYSTARSYFVQALKLASENQDRQFVANVLSSMSLQATYEDEPREAVRLACAAQDAARGTKNASLVMSMLHMREAFAHATLGDEKSCNRAIGKSYDYFDSSITEGQPPDWL